MGSDRHTFQVFRQRDRSARVRQGLLGHCTKRSFRHNAIDTAAICDSADAVEAGKDWYSSFAL